MWEGGGGSAESASDVSAYYRFSLGIIFPQPRLIIGRFMWIKWSSSLPPHHVSSSLATLRAATAASAWFVNPHPRPSFFLRFVRTSFPLGCMRDDGQPDSGSAARPVRSFPRRDGGLPVPPEPPSRLRISRASTSVRVRGAFLHRRITQWILRGFRGQFQPPAVLRLRVERR